MNDCNVFHFSLRVCFSEASTSFSRLAVEVSAKLSVAESKGVFSCARLCVRLDALRSWNQGAETENVSTGVSKSLPPIGRD